MRFRKYQRITCTADYQHARESGKRIRCNAFLFQLVKRDKDIAIGKDTPRIGIIASRKVGNAVKRNLAKRYFREIFRHEQNIIPRNCDIVIIVYSHFDKFSYEALLKQFIIACKKCQA